MKGTIILICFFLSSLISRSQQAVINKFISDSLMIHASVSLSIIDASTGETISEYNPQKSLTQASILKLVTTAAALEKLGGDYTFKTRIGYSGKIRKGPGILEGNIIIKGGGDPSLGSENFAEQYSGFVEKWVDEIRKVGIRKINGRIIADDSYYDYQPVPAGWSWEDMGNYYGSGAYGISVYDNTYYVHFITSEKGSHPKIADITPEDTGIELSCNVTADGTADNGYIYSAPYSSKGWISGTIPENKEDFVLKGSIPDPPLFLAKTVNKKLRETGIKVSNDPSTTRILNGSDKGSFVEITETVSPHLSSIIEVINHKSVNLYAEHLLRELGKVFKNNGSTEAGNEVIKVFLDSIGIKTDGMFIGDGSGLSPSDAVNAAGMTHLLQYMKKNGRFFDAYYTSLPEAGKDGTLKNYFKDPVFENRLRAKSGSLNRVRSYAGYFTTLSGKDMIFCIIVNNYSGPSRNVITGIEDIIKDVILNK
jgi:D-alanyl-D-alanine carboxypeptidase/D-alanyl-D-alanine-endopeptidase (penicillin-binding protein 4)